MLLRIYKSLKSKEFTTSEIRSIGQLAEFISENETLSLTGDKIKSTNGFLFKELADFIPSPIEFSWLDVDGKDHSGVSKDAINHAVSVLKKSGIPFLIFKTQHENCYKIIIHVEYLSGKSIDYDEYRQINEKFQRHIFAICNLPDYEVGSASATKGFCFSKNKLAVFNPDKSPYKISFAYEPPVRQLPQFTQRDSGIQKTEKEKFEFALKHITTDICPNFESWTRCAMALNATFGDAGIDYFHIISSYYSDKQSPAQVDAKYKACRNAKRVSIGTVYHLIEEAGIVIDWAKFFERESTTLPQKSKAAKKSDKKIVEESKKFSADEDAYYYQMHTFFSIPEMRQLLDDNGIDSSEYEFAYGKKNEVIIVKSGKEVTINNVFSDKYDQFTLICTKKHFCIYQDVIDDKFSFNFTIEEFIEWMDSFPQTIFRNYEYNRATHSIAPKVSNSDHFDITRTVEKKIKNLFASTLNVQQKEFKDFKQSIVDVMSIFLDDFDTKPISGDIKQNNGWMDDVIHQGRKYMACHPNSDTTDYWFDALYSIFSISSEDFTSIVAFLIHSIRVRLRGDDQSMRALIITGDSGIGKDSFLQGCLTGLNYKMAVDYILRGSLYGATGFASANTNKFKSTMYNYISDDLKKANESTDLDTITSPHIGIENKGKDKRFIPKRFNSVITNNDPHVIFGKDKDHNAIARRVMFCSLKYKEGCISKEYRAFYTHYDKQFDGFWAGFFTFCYELEKFNNEVIMLSDIAFNYTLDNLHKMFYAGNEDNRILDMLHGQYEKASEDIDNPIFTPSGNEFIKKTKTADGERSEFIIKSFRDYWKKDNKFSTDAVRRVIKAHILGARLGVTVRDQYGSPVHVAAVIPCEYFEKADTAEHSGIPEEKTNLIENFKKYI